MDKHVLRPLAVVPLGDLAAYVEFSRTLDLEVNALVQRLASAVHALALPSIRDVVPALGGLALHFDPGYEGNCVETASDVVAQCLKAGLPRSDDVVRTVQVPVCYEEEYAPDIKEVAARTKLKVGEVAALHSSPEYRVLMMGFAPGHAYMGGLDGKLALPRRATPRAIVPAGSVAIANEQTVVYPYAISGGWSVIGRTPLTVFDTERQEPSLFASGDRVRFVAIDKAEFMKLAEKR
jgi:KipI family sensor histidine kinase inhibitor